MDASSSTPLNKALHLRYWKRCLRTLLPHHYTPNDSQRMTLGFFIIAAADLLSAATSSSTPNQPPSEAPLLTPADRRDLRQWVLSCQHPGGGFCGSPTHVLPPQHQDAANANIAATYFALLLLAMLAEDDDEEEDGTSVGGAFAGVDRVATLRWLRRLQRPEDGSFGEVVYELPRGEGEGQEGTRVVVGGGKDMRYCYLAATIRWILLGEEEDGNIEDVDVDALVAHIRRSQTYDGGFSETFRHESHAGYGYCAVAALALLDRPLEGGVVKAGSEARREPYYKSSQALQKGISDIPGFISFLVSRQFAYLDPSRDGDDDDDDEEDPETANFQLANLSLSASEDTKHVGFNGRCNKLADTCYTWWVLGSLSILGVLEGGGDGGDTSLTNTVDPASLMAQRDFLLDKTQHAIGGFGKRPGDPPDVYHASLGLAALATMGDPQLKRFDAGLCVSVDTVRKIEKGRRGLMGKVQEEGAGAGSGRVDFGKSLMDMAVSMGGGERPEWLQV